MRALTLSLLLVLGFASCRAAPDGPSDRSAPAPFAPPAWYAATYAALERCSGLQGDYSRIAWYVVRGTEVPSPDPGGWAVAVTYPAEHRIVIARFYDEDTIVVRHEMMHDLAQTTTHPQRWFDASCGDLLP